MKKVHLLELDEVRRRLRIVGQSYAGIRPIEISRIVGSLDRSTDFDRDFTPRMVGSRARVAQLRRAFPDGDFPPIEVYEAGGAYFVSDGHHRVVLAKEQGASYIDAAVTRLETDFAIDAAVGVRQLAHAGAEQTMLHKSGLSEAMPQVAIRLSRPAGYPELQELIEAHGYRLMQARGAVLRAAEVAADWYARVYVPAVAALHQQSIPRLCPNETEADLFLWAYQRRRALRVEWADARFEDAVRDARRQRLRRGLDYVRSRMLRRSLDGAPTLPWLDHHFPSNAHSHACPRA